MPVTGSEIVLSNITKLGGGFAKHVKKTFTKVVNMLDEDVTRNMSLTDHGPKELAKLDHPYATRHGPRGKAIHDPWWLVHRQSGKLLSSKKKGVSDVGIEGKKVSVFGYVGLDEKVAPHALAVIWGTSVMIPRDPLSGSLFNPMFKDKAQSYITSNLKHFIVNFKGVETQ